MKFSELLNKVFMPLYLGSWIGVPVYLHWSWWMMCLFLLIVSPPTASILVGLCGIVILHELGHCYASKLCGYQPHSIMMYIIGGIARVPIDAIDFKSEAFITICGPLVNVLLAPLFLLALAFIPQDSFMYFYIENIAFANLIMLGFNLIPAFPLDGGRLLRALLSWRIGIHSATKYAVTISSILSVLMGLYAISNGSVTLVIIGLFIYHSAQQELQVLQFLEQPKLVEEF